MNNTNKDQKPQENQPQVVINAQYIKDISFQSPKSPMVLVNTKISPKIDLSVDINTNMVTENNYTAPHCQEH